MRAAAQLAAYHSGARGDRAVDVIVTRKRWVQRAPGGKVGQVFVKQEERVVTVRGELPADLTGMAGHLVALAVRWAKAPTLAAGRQALLGLLVSGQPPMAD